MFGETEEGKRSAGGRTRKTHKNSYYKILKPLEIFKGFWKIVHGMKAKVLQSYFICQESILNPEYAIYVCHSERK